MIVFLNWLIFVEVPAIHFPGVFPIKETRAVPMRLHQGFLNFA